MDIGYGIHVFVCDNERPEGHPRGSCAHRHGMMVRMWFQDAMARHGLLDGTRVNRAGCLDYCELGPVVVVYPEGVWYSPKTQEDVEEIVTGHLKGGKPVERLLLRSEV